MKLYRAATPLEINSNKAFYGGAIGFGFFVPIEITEEDIGTLESLADGWQCVYPIRMA